MWSFDLVNLSLTIFSFFFPSLHLFSCTHSPNHTPLTHSPYPSTPPTHSPHPLPTHPSTHSLTHSLTHSPHPLTHPLIHLTHSPTPLTHSLMPFPRHQNLSHSLILFPYQVVDKTILSFQDCNTSWLHTCNKRNPQSCEA